MGPTPSFLVAETLLPPPARARVLLVDAEELDRKALARWLSYEYEVTTASDGQEGLERAAQARPDVVIADVAMPRLDGVTMVRRMRQTPGLRQVPVLFLTGLMSPERVIAGIAAGARAYIPKPVDLDLLTRKLRSALAK
jgi:CheY-like chemotaxis protein